MIDNNALPTNTLLYCTILGFAAISWLIWKCVLSPPPQTGASSASAAAAGGTRSSTTRAGGTGTVTSSTATTPTRRSRAATPSTSNKDSDDDLLVFGQPRHPPHLIAPENWEQTNSDLSGCLLQGIVPFRSTPASGYETRLKNESSSNNTTTADETLSADLVVVNRRERARIFARMFSATGAGSGGRPPNRGANIVVTIHHTEISCSKLQKALFLLGTYYNLFLLVDGSGVPSASGNDMEVKEFIKKLRSELLNQGIHGSDSKEYKLNAEILPQHRIAFSSTSKGRVAFVRQLHGTELVVDSDENVTKELERFGFRVLVYPKNSEGKTVSALGNFLIP